VIKNPLAGKVLADEVGGGPVAASHSQPSVPAGDLRAPLSGGARSRTLAWTTRGLTGVVAVLLALWVVLIAVPTVMGGRTMVVLSGSMQPTINPGDLVVTKGIDAESAEDLRIGDVIVFMPYPNDPTLVTHRIVGKTVGAAGSAFITQGDDNNTIDSWGAVKDFQIVGKAVYSVPKLGYFQQWLGGFRGWVMPAAGVLLLGYAGTIVVGCLRRGRSVGEEEPAEPAPAE